MNPTSPTPPPNPPEEEKSSLSANLPPSLSSAHSHLFNPSKSTSSPEDGAPFKAKSLQRLHEEIGGESFGVESPSSPAERASLNSILESWIQEAPPSEKTNREIAVERTKKFLDDENNCELDLSSLKLSSLPNIWDYKAIKNRLQKLNLSQNRLTTIPSLSNLTNLILLNLSSNQLTTIPSLSNLTNLIQLNLSSNQLTTIPSLSKLTELKSLYLSSNQLTTLEDLSKLTKLERLNLSSNKLTTIPSLSKLTKLEWLDLCKNKLTTIDGLSNLTKLNELDLSTNQLTTINGLSNLTELQNLYLCENQLTTIDGLSNLTKLNWLNLSKNQLTTINGLSNLNNLTWFNLSNNRTLTSLPEDVLELSSDCTVDITGCGLAPAVLTRLCEAVTAQRAMDNGTGPQISYSMETLERGQILSGKTAKAWLDFYYELAKRPFPEFSQEFKDLVGFGSTTSDLATWLSRVSFMTDFAAREGQWEQSLANQILEYVELASDPTRNFLDAFVAKITDAGDTCGDRAALAVLYLGLAKRILEVTPGDLGTLAHLLVHGVWTVELLEQVARERIKKLPFVDEIEVLLAFPVHLKKDLNIPIDIEKMLYLRCSGLKLIENASGEKELHPDEKKPAIELVKVYTESPDAVAEFLIRQVDWIKALQLVREDAAEALAKKDAAMQDLSAMDRADEECNAKLKEITLQELKNHGFFEQKNPTEDNL